MPYVSKITNTYTFMKYMKMFTFSCFINLFRERESACVCACMHACVCTLVYIVYMLSFDIIIFTGHEFTT